MAAIVSFRRRAVSFSVLLLLSALAGVVYTVGCRSARVDAPVPENPIVSASEMIARFNYDGAIERLDKHLKQSPRDGEAHYLRGVALQRQGHTLDAIQEFTLAVQYGYTKGDVYIARGDGFMQQRLADVAAIDYEIALREKPGDVDTLCKMGQACVQANRWARALDCARQAIRLDPLRVKAYELLADSQLASPNIDLKDAIAAIETARQLDAKSPALKTRLAAIYGRQAQRFERLGDKASALASWDRAAKLEPLAREYLAGASRSGNGAPETRTTARPIDGRVAPADPEKAADYVAKGLAAAQAGQSQEAIQQLTAALDLDPSADVYCVRGIEFLKIRSLASALEDLTAAIKRNPRDPRAWAERGRTYLELDDGLSAIHDLTEAIRLDPSRGALYFNRGLAYVKNNQPQLALNDFDNAAICDRSLEAEVRAAKAKAQRP